MKSGVEQEIFSRGADLKTNMKLYEKKKRSFFYVLLGGAFFFLLNLKFKVQIEGIVSVSVLVSLVT